MVLILAIFHYSTIDMFHSYFNDIMDKIGLSELYKSKTYNEIYQHYNNRKYHNLSHLNMMYYCLWLYYNDFGITITPKKYFLLLVSILFHDVIYVPNSSINEELSVDYMHNILCGFISDEDIKFVSDAIMATKHHNFDSHDMMINILQFLDLFYFFNYNMFDVEICENNICEELMGYMLCDLNKTDKLIYLKERIRILSELSVKLKNFIYNNKINIDINNLHVDTIILPYLRNQLLLIDR